MVGQIRQLIINYFIVNRSTGRFSHSAELAQAPAYRTEYSRIYRRCTVAHQGHGLNFQNENKLL